MAYMDIRQTRGYNKNEALQVRNFNILIFGTNLSCFVEFGFGGRFAYERQHCKTFAKRDHNNTLSCTVLRNVVLFILMLHIPDFPVGFFFNVAYFPGIFQYSYVILRICHYILYI